MLEAKDAYPQPKVHPFATSDSLSLDTTIDGFSIPSDPVVSFAHLIKIASDKRRPVSLEYEILPFIPQLVGKWSDVEALASKEQVREYLEDIVDYVTQVAENANNEYVPLPNPVECHKDPGVPPKTLSFEGGKADDLSVETTLRTGVMKPTKKQWPAYLPISEKPLYYKPELFSDLGPIARKVGWLTSEVLWEAWLADTIILLSEFLKGAVLSGGSGARKLRRCTD